MTDEVGAEPRDVSSSGERWAGPSLAGVVGGVVTVVGLLIGLSGLDDNSYLTHLATGRIIWDTGHVPRSDPYSFTAHGHAWVVQSWVASIVYAGAERVGGAGAILLSVGLTSAVLAALLWTLTRPAGSLVARMAIMVPVVLVGLENWVERPLLFGLVALGLLLLAAEGRLDARWMVPVMWVWVNTHGSWPLGLVAVALLAAGDRLDGRSAAPALSALRWAGVGLVVSIVNPFGVRMLAFPIELVSRQHILRNIIEWQAPAFTGISQRGFLLEITLAVVVLARRPSWRLALPLAIFVPAALLGSRNVVVASVVLVPGLAAGLTGLGEVDGYERRPAYRPIGILVVALAALAMVAGLSRPEYRLGSYPVAAVTWMQRQHLMDPGSRVVSRDLVGNYLEARFGTSASVFIDDRYDMFPEDVVDDYLTLYDAKSGWDDVLRRRQATAVLWSHDNAFARVLEEAPGWQVVYSDAHWLVAVPR